MLIIGDIICQIRLSARMDIILDNVYMRNAHTDTSSADMLIQHQVAATSGPAPSISRCLPRCVFWLWLWLISVETNCGPSACIATHHNNLKPGGCFDLYRWTSHLFGDFNCPGSSSDGVDDCLTTLLSCFSLMAVNLGPTRMHRYRGESMLYLIIEPEHIRRISLTSVIPMGYSDHLLVKAELNCAPQLAKSVTYSYRD